MNLNEINAIFWKDDRISEPFDSFHTFALSEGFTYVFTYPMGNTPSAAIAARTLEDLEKYIEPIKGISGFDFIR
ncbi:MAG: hypothetical protein FGM14_08360 [Flavobacteriales bacterium]|nr:hypothetical protein [Flavobacteriales bacterium]